jgi:membrane associated rhomboid family serine protease
MLTESPVALLLFLITIGISVYTLLRDHPLLERLALRPEDVYYERKWYQVLTSGFVHADFAHLAFNMLSYYFFAFALEQYLGSAEFLILYLGSIMLSDLPSVFDHKDDPNYLSLGASGGVSAVIFSYILFEPGAKLRFLFIPIDIPAFVYAIGFLAYSFYASKYIRTYVNHKAHLWGALSGIGLTVLLSPYVREELFDGIRNVFH